MSLLEDALPVASKAQQIELRNTADNLIRGNTADRIYRYTNYDSREMNKTARYLSDAVPDNWTESGLRVDRPLLHKDDYWPEGGAVTHVRKINDKILRSHLKSPLFVYHGLKDRIATLGGRYIAIDYMKSKAQVGEIVTLYGITSVSLLPDVALEFTGETCCFIQIKLPAGYPCLFVDEWSATPGEMECLLPFEFADGSKKMFVVTRIKTIQIRGKSVKMIQMVPHTADTFPSVTTALKRLMGTDDNKNKHRKR